ncbi:hypothetical protein D3C84_1169760 [compost metagenome]
MLLIMRTSELSDCSTGGSPAAGAAADSSFSSVFSSVLVPVMSNSSGRIGSFMSITGRSAATWPTFS